MTSCARPSAGPPAAASAADAVDERHHRDRRAARHGVSLIAARREVPACAGAAPTVGRAALRRAPASRIGAASSPSASNSRAVAARCSSPSRSRPRAASACSSALVHARIERRQREPGFQVTEQVFAIGLRDEMLQQRHVAGAEAAPLRGQPGVERRAAVDLQPFEKLAREQRAQRAQALGRDCCDACFGRAGDLDRIDEAVRRDRAGPRRRAHRPAAGRARRPARGSCSGTSAARRADRCGTSHSSSQSWLRGTARGASAR